MKKLRKALLIILAAALLLSLIGIVAGAVLGAHPVDIAREIYQGLTASINLKLPGAQPKPQVTAAPLP